MQPVIRLERNRRRKGYEIFKGLPRTYTNEGVTEMTISELNEKGIKYYPDNDGGLWYWDENGEVKTVKE